MGSRWISPDFTSLDNEKFNNKAGSAWLSYGCRIQDAGCRIQDTRYRIQDTGCRPGVRVGLGVWPSAVEG
jgi:hypothetical protein